MTELSYGNLDKRLVEMIPELRVPYESERRWWKGEKPGQHIIVGDILTPFLRTLLDGGGKLETITRVFAYLEELASSQSKAIQEIVAFSVLEQLIDDQKIIDTARTYMGPRTLEILNEIETSAGAGQ